jgi:hypothetical protein
MIVFDKIKMEEANKKLFVGKNSLIQNIIFVYTPIKVGSTTLVTSIRISANHYFVVLHIHDEKCLKVLTGIQNITINDLILYNSMIGKNVYVIDVYRSPIERKMSTFFELIEMHFNNSQENINNYPLSKINNRFNSIFPYIANEDYMKDNKFEITLPEKFDCDKKFLFIKERNVNYIKLRLKDSNEWGSILSLLLQKEIVIVNDYETSSKQIKNLYENFKRNYKIPLNLLEEIKNDPYLNYYYSNDEKRIYLNEWEKKTCENVVFYNAKEYDLYSKITKENSTRNFLQLNHYIDADCSCSICNRKRREIFERVKKGEKIIEKIDHSALVEKFLNEKNKNIQQKVNIINKMNQQNILSKKVKKEMIINYRS